LGGLAAEIACMGGLISNLTHPLMAACLGLVALAGVLALTVDAAWTQLLFRLAVFAIVFAGMFRGMQINRQRAKEHLVALDELDVGAFAEKYVLDEERLSALVERDRKKLERVSQTSFRNLYMSRDSIAIALIAIVIVVSIYDHFRVWRWILGLD
jgi:hypothetical protein